MYLPCHRSSATSDQSLAMVRVLVLDCRVQLRKCPELYGEHGYGIDRQDKDGMAKARSRNYEFFGAPVIGVISMHHDLAMVDAMSVGMFVQSLMLALTERRLGTCLQVSVTGYPEVSVDMIGACPIDIIMLTVVCFCRS